MYSCDNIKYLFSPLMAKLLINLKIVSMHYCRDIEEVVSNRDDEDKEMSASTSIHTNTIFFPHFRTLILFNLPCLKHIGGGGAAASNAITTKITTSTASIRDGLQHAQVAVGSWSLCQYPREIRIYNCSALLSVIPSYAVGHVQKLEELTIRDCESMMELFETKRPNNTSFPIDEGSSGSSVALIIPRLTNMTSLELPNLMKLCLSKCNLLGHIFTFSTLESLKQLKELEIKDCETIQVIVKEEDRDHITTSKVVVFPCLKSLTLIDLPNLKGFFHGMNDFLWPFLHMVKIDGCPKMIMFTSGHSMAPKLKYIYTILGKHILECGLNFHLTTTLHETPFPSLDGSNSCPILKRIPWSFSNLIEIDLYKRNDLRNIVPSSKLLQLQELEKIDVMHCNMLEEVFETFNGTNRGLNESQSVVKFPKLREVDLNSLRSLKYIWKSNQWTALEFPSLARVSINRCNKLEHVFTCSMVGSLLQLQELEIRDCDSMEVIVMEEDPQAETRVNEVVFPCLKSLKLNCIKNLKGFCLGMEAFIWPLLDTLEIKGSPEITVFTIGQSTTPKLKVMDTNFGLCHVIEDPNSFIRTKKQEGFKFG